MVPRREGRAFPRFASLHVEILHLGSPGHPPPKVDDVVHVHYATMLADTGRLVDTSRAGAQQHSRVNRPMVVVIGAGGVVPGFEQGIRGLTLGALARIHCPTSLGYGAAGSCNSVPPNADLVFEVELVRHNAAQVGGLRMPQLRRLLMLPVPVEPSRGGGALPSGGAAAAVTAPRELAATAAAASAYESDPDDDDDACGEVETEVAGGASVAEEDERRWPWLARLRPKIPSPTPEGAHFYALMEAMGPQAWREALRRRTDGTDGAQELLPGSLPIRRCAYGTPFDSRTPMVMTGARDAWPCFRWGWRYWGEGFGDSLATAKQRAPIFDSDVLTDSAVAECTLREYVQYARHAHERPLAAQRATPNLYMNGWELFNEHPGLWEFDMARLCGPGGAQSIDNLTAGEYGTLQASMGVHTSAESVGEYTRQFNKLFLSPRGAITRMHQDNHHAHAWLSQVRGRKLYVLCKPQDYALVAPRGKSADGGGTTREAIFDPLDPEQRASRVGRGLQVFATVLQPGETIVCPDSWWHYAVSLTPSLTHMCNFWDGKNKAGLRDMCMMGCKPAPPEAPLANAPQRLRPASTSRAVVLRERPASEEASVVGAIRPGEAASFDVECAGWVRTRVGDGGAEGSGGGGGGARGHGWALRSELVPA